MAVWKLSTHRARVALAVWAAILSVVACGGGSPADTPPDSVEPNTPISDYVAFAPAAIDARVGKTALLQLRYKAEDLRNAVTGFQISNPTVGGATPTIDANGKVYFTPVEADLGTTAMSVVMTLRTGQTKTVNVPVVVVKEVIPTTFDLQADQSVYSDPRGTYVIRVGTSDGSALSGSVKIIEKWNATQVVGVSAWPSNPMVWVELVRQPLSNNATSSASSSSKSIMGLNRRISKAPQSGLTMLDPFTVRTLFGIDTLGSILGAGAGAGGSNIATTRRDMHYPDVVTDVSLIPPSASRHTEYRLATQETVFQIDATCSTIAACQAGNTGAPVILIHGFTPESLGLGGGEGTWGTLAQRLLSVPDTARHVFELRWLTHMRFEEAAGTLARVIRSVQELTGKAPVVLGGSFGGIVARLALGGAGIQWNAVTQAWETVPAPNAQRLITFGTPHSGIHDLNGGASLTVGRTTAGDDVQRTFVRGRASPDSEINVCEAITCIQAGAYDTYADLALNAGLDRRGDHYNIYLEWIKSPGISQQTYQALEGLARSPGLGHLFAGETIAKFDGLSISAPMTVVVGVTPAIYSTLVRSDLDRIGDQLISYRGQMVAGAELDLSSDIRDTLDAELREVPPLHTVGNVEYLLVRNGRHTGALQHGGLWAVPEANYSGTHNSYCPAFEYAWLPVFACEAQLREARSHIDYLIDRYLTGAVADAPLTAAEQVALQVTGRFAERATNAPVGLLAFKLSLYRKADNRLIGNEQGVSRAIDGGFDMRLGHLVPASERATFDASAYRAVLSWGDNATWNISSKEISVLLTPGPVAVGTVVVDPNTPLASGSLAGYVIDGQTQGTVVPGATIYLRRGIDLSAFELYLAPVQTTTSRTVTSSSSGAYSITGLEPGEYSALIVKEGWTSAVNGRLVVGAGSTQNLSILRVLPNGEASVTLRWLAGGSAVSRDLDSHLLRLTNSGAMEYHIYFSATVAGADNLDRDDTSYEGPETITFALQTTKNYVYFVHNYTSVGTTIPASEPDVVLRIGAIDYRFRLPGGEMGTQRYWRVFDLVGGRVVPCVTGCLTANMPTAIATPQAAVDSVTAAEVRWPTKRTTMH